MMSIQAPPLFKAGDRILYRLTAPDAFRIPYTLVEALNQGNLFDRGGKVFAEAAGDRRLYEVMIAAETPEDERIIGTGMFQETFRDRDGIHHRNELDGAVDGRWSTSAVEPVLPRAGECLQPRARPAEADATRAALSRCAGFSRPGRMR